MSLNAALGETAGYEFDRRVVVPKSLYPVTLGIVDVGVSEVKPDGTGGAPFVEINASIYAGPFAGIDVRKRTYMTAGKNGGALGRFAGWCKAITRQPAAEEAFKQFGFEIPPQGNIPDKDVKDPLGNVIQKGYFTIVRETVRDKWATMDPATRLKFVTTYVRIQQWDGKKAIAGIVTESYEYTKNGETKTATSNAFDSFFALDDPKFGFNAYNNVTAPKQAEWYAAMSAQGLL